MWKIYIVGAVIEPRISKILNVQESQKQGCLNTIMNGTAFFYHATVALSFQIEICNLDRTKSTSLISYKFV